MKAKLSSFFNTILGFILLGIVVLGIYKVLVAIEHAIVKIQWQKVDPALGAVLISGTISIIGIVIGQYYSRKREIELENRKKQVEAYENFLDKLFHFFNEEDEEKKNQLMQKLNLDFTQDVMLWSSKRVLKKFFEFKEFSKYNPDNGAGVLLRLENLIFAMRGDLGHHRKMKSGELLSIMFNETSAELRMMLGIKK
jgi:hypothetical protein